MNNTCDLCQFLEETCPECAADDQAGPVGEGDLDICLECGADIPAGADAVRLPVTLDVFCCLECHDRYYRAWQEELPHPDDPCLEDLAGDAIYS